MLFPQLAPEYYNEVDRPILSKMEAFYAESITIHQSYWGEADTDTRFWAGDQTLWNDLYGNLPANRRRQFSFNRIRRVINMITGHQRRNRKSTIAIPISNGDQLTADQFSKILMWCDKHDNILETISRAFEGSCVAGMNLLQVWMDYRNDPINGNIRVDLLDYNDFLIDPYFRKPDLSDCNNIWRRKYMTKREVLSLMPNREDEIMGLYGGYMRDGKFEYQPEAYNYGLKNLLTWDEFWYRDFRTAQMLCDTQTGETLEWKKQDDDQLRLFMQQNPSVTMIKQEIPTTRVAIVVQGRVMYDGANPMGIDSWPFILVPSYYAPQMPYMNWRIQGVVRGLRDAQYLYNRRRIIELDILESQITSGFKYKENSLVNPKDIFLSGQGKGLALKEEAQMTDVEQIQPPQVPPSMIQLSELLGKEISEISGVNEELLGSAVDDKAGILSMLRQGAGLTTLQGLFDNLDQAQKQLGKVMLELIQANFTPGKVKKILEGEEPTDQFYNKAFGEYNCIVEEGLNTSTQKQMQFAQMLALKEAGVPIQDSDLLEAATLQNKDKIIQNLQSSQQQQQQQVQQQQDMAMQVQMAQLQGLQAKAQADLGLAEERKMRVQVDEAQAIEKIHEANKQDDEALLNKIRALKELEMLDLTHIEKLISMANMLKADETQAAQGVQQ